MISALSKRRYYDEILTDNTTITILSTVISNKSVSFYTQDYIKRNKKLTDTNVRTKSVTDELIQ